MWKLYDELLSQVHNGEVKEAIVGLSWAAVESNNVGLAMGAERPKNKFQMAGELRGMPIPKMASFVKSWDPIEASLGLSAINSSLNTSETIKALERQGGIIHEEPSVFDTIAKVAPGKKVAVVGHFPVLQKLQEVCDLTILERAPQKGDLPDPAAEYILQDQDIVVMTSSTIINKTAPRLLELSKDAFTIFVGPSTPYSQTLFDMGANMLAGLVVNDKEDVLQFVKEGGGLRGFRQYVDYVNMYQDNHPLSQLFMNSNKNSI